MADKMTPFDYLLNGLERAAASDQPARAGYAAKRRALFAYVNRLESAVDERTLRAALDAAREQEATA